MAPHAQVPTLVLQNAASPLVRSPEHQLLTGPGCGAAGPCPPPRPAPWPFPSWRRGGSGCSSHLYALPARGESRDGQRHPAPSQVRPSQSLPGGHPPPQSLGNACSWGLGPVVTPPDDDGRKKGCGRPPRSPAAESRSAATKSQRRPPLRWAVTCCPSPCRALRAGPSALQSPRCAHPS